MSSSADRSQKQQEKTKGFFQVSQYDKHEEDTYSALTGFIFFSALMITMPLLVYCLVNDWIRNDFPYLKSPWNMIYSAIAAVITVNVIIALYIWKAFREEREEKKTD